MAVIAIPADAWKHGINWNITSLHVLVHTFGLIGMAVAWPAIIEQFKDIGLLALSAYFAAANLSLGPLAAGWQLMPASLLLRALLFAEVFAFACHLSIRLGVHSLYTHRAYKAALAWHIAMVGLFTATMQGTALFWPAKHELHHKEDEHDPYSVKDGILWAHMLWTCFNSPPIDYLRTVPWLFRRKTSAQRRLRALLIFQQRYSGPAGLVLGVVVPTMIMSFWVGPVDGFLLAMLRLLCQYHFTWQINSLSHLVGPQTFDRRGSSHDSPWWLFGVPSLLSVGEAGGHNFHHRYPGSFWISWFDPGAWALLAIWAIGVPFRWIGLPQLRLVWDLIYVDRHGRPHVLA